MGERGRRWWEWVWGGARWGGGRRDGHVCGRIVGRSSGRHGGRRGGRLCGRSSGRLCDRSSGRRGGRLSSGNSCCRGDLCRSRCGGRRLCRRRRARLASTSDRSNSSAAAHGGDFLLGSATLNASVEYLLWAWGSRRGPRGRDGVGHGWVCAVGVVVFGMYVWMFCTFVCKEERRRM